MTLELLTKLTILELEEEEQQMLFEFPEHAAAIRYMYWVLKTDAETKNSPKES